MVRFAFVLIVVGISAVSHAESIGSAIQKAAIAERDRRLSRDDKGQTTGAEKEAKRITISRKDINEAVQLVKGRDATPEEIRRSKEFFKENPLPPSFPERKELVDKLIKTTFQEEETTREDRKKVMGLLYRKEREAQEAR